MGGRAGGRAGGWVGGEVGRWVAGLVGWWVAGFLGCWVGGLVGRWVGGPLGLQTNAVGGGGRGTGGRGGSYPIGSISKVLKTAKASCPQDPARGPRFHPGAKAGQLGDSTQSVAFDVCGRNEGHSDPKQRRPGP